MSVQTDLIRVEDLRVAFMLHGSPLEVVKGISFRIRPGSVVALVGESGSGKSVTALSILGLVATPPGKIVGGSITYRDRDLLQCTLSELQQFNLKMLLKYMEPVKHYVHTVSEMHSVSQTLELFTEQLGIHLLALLHYQHSYLEQFTREPVVKRTAFHSQIPLLVIPELGMEIRTRKTKEKEVSLN